MDYINQILNVAKTKTSGEGIADIKTIAANVLADNINDYKDIYELSNMLNHYVDLYEETPKINKLDIDFEKVFGAIDKTTNNFEYLDTAELYVLTVLFEEFFNTNCADLKNLEKYRIILFDKLNTNMKSIVESVGFGYGYNMIDFINTIANKNEKLYRQAISNMFNFVEKGQNLEQFVESFHRHSRGLNRNDAIFYNEILKINNEKHIFDFQYDLEINLRLSAQDYRNSFSINSIKDKTKILFDKNPELFKFYLNEYYSIDDFFADNRLIATSNDDKSMDFIETIGEFDQKRKSLCLSFYLNDYLIMYLFSDTYEKKSNEKLIKLVDNYKLFEHPENILTDIKIAKASNQIEQNLEKIKNTYVKYMTETKKMYIDRFSQIDDKKQYDIALDYKKNGFDKTKGSDFYSYAATLEYIEINKLLTKIYKDQNIKNEIDIETIDPAVDAYLI